jgi:thiol-disulfide isomerase/thioredoxin
MFKKIIVLFLFFISIFPFDNAFAQVEKSSSPKEVNIYFFWGEGCPHCEKEKPFLENLKKKYSQVKIMDYEIWQNSGNRNLMIEFGKKLNANVSGVPFTVIGEEYFIGWLSEEYTGAQIEDAVKCAINKGCRDIGGEINNIEKKEEKKEISENPEKITLPFLGEIEVKNFSLPVLTIIMGALDGFNPCAMWTLLFLISLLLGMESRKRMWILGSVFIVVSASVYFAFMSAWLNLIMFIGMILWVRIAIGLVALIGGSYNLKEYFTNKNSGCKITKTKERKRIMEKLKKITYQKSFYLALGGIIVLAFAVNLVEMICSAGLPVVYTQILSMSDLKEWQYYLYIFFYVLIFMLDDLIVFFVAMITLQMAGITTKYTRWSHLIGGILMFIIGILLIFKPEWLMFG